MATVTIPAGSLVLDRDLYPRDGGPSNANVVMILEALRAGESMPPVIAEEGTLRVVDGWHRTTAVLRLSGPEGPIEADLRTYPSEAELLAEAVKLNVGRGLDLSRWDHMRCADLADKVGLPQATLAGLLGWEPARFAAYRQGRTGLTLDERRIPLKRSLRHMLERPLTPVQEQAHSKLDGMQASYHADQLIRLLEADLMPSKPELWQRLALLADLINNTPPAEAVG